MTDSATETRLTRRIPRDKFEAELFERLIRAEIATWPESMEPNIERGHVDGVWKLHVTKSQPFDPMTFLSRPMVTGEIWIDEREYPASEYYRVAVSWRLGDQSNTGYPPVMER